MSRLSFAVAAVSTPDLVLELWTVSRHFSFSELLDDGVGRSHGVFSLVGAKSRRRPCTPHSTSEVTRSYFLFDTIHDTPVSYQMISEW